MVTRRSECGGGVIKHVGGYGTVMLRRTMSVHEVANNWGGTPPREYKCVKEIAECIRKGDICALSAYLPHDWVPKNGSGAVPGQLVRGARNVMLVDKRR